MSFLLCVGEFVWVWGVSVYCVWDNFVCVWGFDCFLCVGEFVWDWGVSVCCVWDSLVWVWWCECVLFVGQIGVGLGE